MNRKKLFRKIISIFLVVALLFFWSLSDLSRIPFTNFPFKVREVKAAQVILTTADTSPWTVPSNWNDSGNTIEVIGGGGGGVNGGGASVSLGGAGGGGGAYGKSVNINLPEGGQVTFSVGTGGGVGSAGGNTWICNSTASCANYTDANVVASADGGSAGSTSTGGAGGDATGVVSGTGSLESTGGAGGNGSTVNGTPGGGGGGTGGPNGNGAAGGAASTTAGRGGSGGGGNGGGSIGGTATGTNGANGGNNSGGTGGGTGGAGTGGNGSNGGGGAGGAGANGPAFAGGDGSQGTEWTGAGTGGGAGGGGSTTRTTGSGNNGGNAGATTASTGAGGGGGGDCTDAGCTGGTGSSGAAGFIVITYTPIALAEYTQNHYRWYVDSDNENVTDPWSATASIDLTEDTALTPLPFAYDPPNSSQELRLRVNITVNTATITGNTKYFKLQHRTGTDTDCSTGSWTDVGTGAWDYATSTVTDDTTLTVAKLTGTDRLETYSKAKPANTPTGTSATGEDIEFDFHIVGTSSTSATRYLFRVVETTSDGSGTTNLAAWTNCPVLHTEPGVDNQMRHGNFFSGSVEQGFFWTD